MCTRKCSTTAIQAKGPCPEGQSRAASPKDIAPYRHCYAARAGGRPTPGPVLARSIHASPLRTAQGAPATMRINPPSVARCPRASPPLHLSRSTHAPAARSTPHPSGPPPGPRVLQPGPRKLQRGCAEKVLQNEWPQRQRDDPHRNRPTRVRLEVHVLHLRSDLVCLWGLCPNGARTHTNEKIRDARSRRRFRKPIGLEMPSLRHGGATLSKVVHGHLCKATSRVYMGSFFAEIRRCKRGTRHRLAFLMRFRPSSGRASSASECVGREPTGCFFRWPLGGVRARGERPASGSLSEAPLAPLGRLLFRKLGGDVTAGHGLHLQPPFAAEALSTGPASLLHAALAVIRTTIQRRECSPRLSQCPWFQVLLCHCSQGSPSGLCKCAARRFLWTTAASTICEAPSLRCQAARPQSSTSTTEAFSCFRFQPWLR